MGLIATRWTGPGDPIEEQRDRGPADLVALAAFLVVVLALAVSTAVLALVASVERPDARLRDVLRAFLYLGVRRWYLSLAALVILRLAALFTLHPALAIGLSATPLLYALWSNARFTLAPILSVGSGITT